MVLLSQTIGDYGGSPTFPPVVRAEVVSYADTNCVVYNGVPRFILMLCPRFAHCWMEDEIEIEHTRYLPHVSPSRPPSHELWVYRCRAYGEVCDRC